MPQTRSVRRQPDGLSSCVPHNSLGKSCDFTVVLFDGGNNRPKNGHVRSVKLRWRSSMAKGLWTAGLTLVLCASLQGQSAPTTGFEIAAIQPSATSAITVMRGGAVRDGRYELRGATMVDLIRTAYAVDADK